MTLVVWTVEVHAVPACREGDLGTNTTFAHASREEGRILFRAWGAAERLRVFVNAAMADAAGFASSVAENWVTGEHAEALMGKSDEVGLSRFQKWETNGLERSHVAITVVWRYVIHSHTTLLVQSKIRILLDAFVGAVLRCAIIQRRSPVVAEACQQ
jgi:hypothetical protein